MDRDRQDDSKREEAGQTPGQDHGQGQGKRDGDLSKAQEDAAKERAEKGGYQ